MLQYEQSPAEGIDPGALGAALPGFEELRLCKDSSLVSDALLHSLACRGVLRVVLASAADSSTPRWLTVAGWSTLLSACPVEHLSLSGLSLVASAAAVLDTPPAPARPRDAAIPAASGGAPADAELPFGDAVDSPAAVEVDAASALEVVAASPLEKSTVPAHPASYPAAATVEGAATTVTASTNCRVGNESGEHVDVDHLPLL